jgi:murein DD-endopeptidase MepM/ murein hydrolase activator NlpD
MISRMLLAHHPFVRACAVALVGCTLLWGVGVAAEEVVPPAVAAAQRDVLLAFADACGTTEDGPTCGLASLESLRVQIESAADAARIDGDRVRELVLQIAAASIDIALYERETHGHADTESEAAAGSRAPVDEEFLQRFGVVEVDDAPRAVGRDGSPALVARPVARAPSGVIAARPQRRTVVLVAPEDGDGASDDTCELWSVPVRDPRVTSRFGPRVDPITGRAGRMHRGVDYGGPTGTPVYATASGRVLMAGWCDRGTGNCIVIDHGNGWRSQYFHLSAVRARAGARVAQGEEIGAIGSTGRSTGPHLHFQVGVDGVAIDPERLFDQAVGQHPPASR